MNKYSFFKKKYNGVEEVKGNRNNHSFIFKENNKKKFFKIFTRKSSFQRELNFYKNFKDSKVKKNIPKFLSYSHKEKYIILEFVKLKKYKDQDKYLKHLFKFVVDTNIIRVKNKWNSREKFISPKHFVNKIKLRIKKLVIVSEAENFKHPKLKKLIQILITKLEKILKKVNSDKSNKNQELFSQSDIGIHNAGIFNSNPIFFDFEYCGLDNPIKMMSDTYYQPEFNIEYKNYKVFFKKIKKHFNFKFNENDLLIEQLLKIKMVTNVCNIFVKEQYVLDGLDKVYLENLKKKRLIKCFKILKKKSFLI